MRWRVLLIVSLCANIGLALAWFLSTRGASSSLPVTTSAAVGTNAQRGKPTVLVRRQFFNWHEVEAEDYSTYIANLRDIGCPEQTIRDIIIADVNFLFARRRATEVTNAAQQWWRSEPDAAVLSAAVQKTRELETERRALLTGLLGANWEGGDLINLPRPSRTAMALDGSVLGNLPGEVKQSLQNISLRSQDKMTAYLDAQRAAGKEPDPIELAKIRQETRTELAGVLAPAQLEEFLLRYSQNANNLRAQLGELQHFNASPDEFRAVFRAIDQIDQQLELLGDSAETAAAAQRQALELQRENAIKVALGPKRYEQYQVLQDPVYRDAYAAAQQAGTPDAAQTLYQINTAAAEELERIRAITNLTAEQREIELKRAELEQLRAAAEALGQNVPDETPPLPPMPKKVHVIQPGESVGNVAAEYGVPISEIREANPGVDFTKLKVGDSIYVPQVGIIRP